MHFYVISKKNILHTAPTAPKESITSLQTIILMTVEDPAGEFTYPTDLNLKQLESGGDDSEYKDKSILWTLNLDRLDQILRDTIIQVYESVS